MERHLFAAADILRGTVEEHGGDTTDMFFASQDANSGSWIMATMNMVLHGVRRFDPRTVDTLAGPAHVPACILVLRPKGKKVRNVPARSCS
ncbi:N-6 DNA methylase [Acrocarpospora sp. B8E8]|uniref:N-6 DNA methylase n=1 Tax=Acrocarpospora sp. B8E8 TaxID=3153572 RepID=UPI00325F2E17